MTPDRPMRDAIEATAEYRRISDYYGDRRARRSGVLLMQHIDEGLWLLRRIGADAITQRAWCLHPIAQDAASDELAERAVDGASADARVCALALEYRRVANATLSTRSIESSDDILASQRREVSQMLVADKVQNRKDFLKHHKDAHPRADALDRYFRLWLEHLEVTEAQFVAWCRELELRSVGSLPGRED